MNKVLLAASIFLFTFVGYSCKRKPLFLSKAPKDTINHALENFHIKELNYTYLHIKSKVNYSDDKSEVRFNVNTRIKKDSVIWMSITGGPGVEVVRVMILQDSILVLNKGTGNGDAGLYRYNFDYLSETLNMVVNYRMLQAMITGNLMLRTLNKDSLFNPDNKGMQQLYQERKNMKVNNWIDTLYMRIATLEMEQPSTGNKLSVEYTNFAPLDSINFANTNVVKTAFKKEGKEQNTTITIQHSKVEVSPKELSFPFNIPNRYDENR